MKRKYGSSGYRSTSSGKTSSKRRKVYARTSGLAPGRTGGFFNRQTSLSRTPERKIIDSNLSNNYISDSAAGSGNVTLVNGVAQGSDINNRIGRRYTNVSVQMRYTCVVAATTPTPLPARTMLVYDLQTNGPTNVPAITDILQFATTVSPMNINNRDRFRVIYDKTYTVSPNGPEIFYTKMFKKLSLVTTNNAGTTATIGSISTGALYLITIGDTSSSSNQTVTGEQYVRVRFTDE